MDNWSCGDEVEYLFNGSRDADAGRFSGIGGGPLRQPVGGEGPPEPDLNSYSVENSAAAPGRSKSRRSSADRDEDVDFRDVGIECFTVPATATVSPGLKPIKEPSVCGVSSRRRGRSTPPVIERYEDEFVNSTCEMFLDEDELPVRMPKLPFASRLVMDLDFREGSQPPGNDDYHRWLDHGSYSNRSPLAQPLKEDAGEELGGVEKPPRRFNSPRNREMAKVSCRMPQGTFAEIYAKGPPPTCPLVVGIDSEPQLFASPVARAADLSADEDEDSYAQELLADSPRTIMCSSTCRLDSLENLMTLPGGMMPSLQHEAASHIGPTEDAMNGLDDFLGGADDAVLSYILDLDANAEEAQAPGRLAPGMPLPGQVPGFPLRL